MLLIGQNARQNVLCGEVSSILKIILAGLKSRGSGWRVLHYFPVDILPERSSTAAPPTIKCDKMLRWGRKGGWGVGCTACLTLSNISPSWTWLWRTGVMLSPIQLGELTPIVVEVIHGKEGSCLVQTKRESAHEEGRRKIFINKHAPWAFQNGLEVARIQDEIYRDLQYSMSPRGSWVGIVGTENLKKKKKIHPQFSFRSQRISFRTEPSIGTLPCLLIQKKRKKKCSPCFTPFPFPSFSFFSLWSPHSLLFALCFCVFCFVLLCVFVFFVLFCFVFAAKPPLIP